jgi:hypothetical protein
MADTATVTLNATVAEYIAIMNATGSTIGDLDITQGSGVPVNNNSGATGLSTKASFEVASNVPYNITLDWQTWQEAGLAIPAGVPATFEQANFVNGGSTACSIGGIVSFDPTPTSPVTNDIVRPSGGATPLLVPTDFAPGLGDVYGINTEASPIVNNCPGGVAAPGTYSLDVEITVAAATP